MTRIRTWITGGYALALVLIVIVAAEAMWSFRRYQTRQRTIRQTREVTLRLEEGLGVLIDAESRERGFLLTGEERILTAGRPSIEQVDQLLSELKTLTTDDPPLHRQILQLADLADARIAFMDRTIALASAGKREQALALLRTGEGERLMTRSRELTSQLVSEKRHQVAHMLARSQANAWRVGLFLAFGNSVAFILLAGSWIVLKREQLHRRELIKELSVQRERECLHAKLQQEKERVDQILQEMPVGVCIAEAPSGRIVYNNQAVAAIYRGRLPRIESIEDYRSFDIRTPNGLQVPVEDNPLTRAIKEGEAVHGLELRLERQTGDSATLKVNAAPLRDHSGEVIAAVAVFEDFTAEKRALDELAQAAHFREMFMSLLGHDLRNPLTVLTTGVQVLTRHPHDSRETRILERMTSSAARMARMIDQLIDFTRSRLGGGIPIERQHTDLGQIARHAAHAVEVQSDHAIEVTTDGDAVGPWDPVRMAEVVSNLLSNAAQHGGAESKVTAHVHGGQEDVTVEVHNEGPPIPTQFLPVLFDPFRRAAERKRMKSTGLGLGLYLTQQIVEAHGGEITVDSDRERGTTFRVTLPRPKGA